MVDVEVKESPLGSVIPEAPALPPIYLLSAGPLKSPWYRQWLAWEYTWLCLLATLLLALHFSIVFYPTDLVFDEAHYVKDARSILAGKGTTISEHAPFGKLFIIAGVKLFGDNPIKLSTDAAAGQNTISVYSSTGFLEGFPIIIGDDMQFEHNTIASVNEKQATLVLTEDLGATYQAVDHAFLKYDAKPIIGPAPNSDSPTLGWRFFPIIMGVVGIFFFYLVCRHLKMSKTSAYAATFFLAFDNLTFVQTQVAMLDAFLLPTMTIAFYLYLKRWYLPAGVVVGLSALVKFTGALILPAMMLHWIILRRRERDWKILGMILLSGFSFVALMPAFDYLIFGRFTNPLERVQTIMKLGSSLTFVTAKHPSMSRPWDWVLKVDMMPYWYTPHYVATVSLTIWMLIIPVVLYMIYRSVRRNEASIFSLCWFLCTYLPWIPFSLITNRISFVYYFFPTTGAISIGLGLAFNQVLGFWKTTNFNTWRWASITVLVAFVLLHLAVFIILSPFTSWWKYPIPPS